MRVTPQGGLKKGPGASASLASP